MLSEFSEPQMQPLAAAYRDQLQRMGWKPDAFPRKDVHGTLYNSYTRSFQQDARKRHIHELFAVSILFLCDCG
ncbi:hypothetical protein H8B02_07190 [Bradyrhizobium sp. Pear77]|uniref:hypothetical protein n=1 Tax=Bradyrhizobium altum TaxID=1571202 RepID=UPI001E55DAEB|nr:hypothetical protein [Bradyrhizobium altum]MCC8953256.1 hypothetical protein [Bradyrhizobium altum]